MFGKSIIFGCYDGHRQMLGNLVFAYPLMLALQLFSASYLLYAAYHHQWGDVYWYESQQQYGEYRRCEKENDEITEKFKNSFR